ncbi:hypothetical protein LTR56_015094 [Elasticomyces elasticus]|nr:hypothetical protein LTR56_015094 [Elasticomyces elasticus]KAK3639316.1 hypothetical protein LTR22_017517 [Elasticomyces elasticus]KAK4915729.1 hypothetical protein LTR49_016213 [Elasticomyces elasticus]KAK5746080.1 hypothetical protein LTS12_022894 [Elasticomyces elasticus]
MPTSRSKWCARSHINKESMQNPLDSAWSTVTRFSLPFKPAYLDNGWSEERLAPYEGYKHLYWERKDAHKYSSTPYPFLALPAEIRNKIYEFVLVHGAIELAPLHAIGKNNGRLRIHHMKRYKREIVPGLKMLRVCKQINVESTPVFYGQNEFRFSNTYGFDIFAHFARTIGKRNLALVRKITECYPKPPSRPGIRNDGQTGRSITGLANFETVMRKMGLKVNTHRNGNPARGCTHERTADLMRLDGGLQKYRFVIAEEHLVDPDFHLATVGGLLSHMSWAKLAGIRVQVVLLQARVGSWDVFDEFYEPGRQNHDEHVGQIVDYLWNCGWEVVHATYDELGRYEVGEYGGGYGETISGNDGRSLW